jgi:enamine deaminase RidA (YjgF/YER057c/UK114 family)
MSFETQLQALQITLPATPKPVFSYVPAVQTGNLIFVSGQTPKVDGKLSIQGKPGKDISIAQAQEAARIAILNCLAAVRSMTGSLDAIVRIVKVTGYVASPEGFGNQPTIIDGASQLLEDIFGAAGKHARAAIGVAELPGGAPVEIELIVEVQPA